jgi:CheY-like chemotaxis protein
VKPEQSSNPRVALATASVPDRDLAGALHEVSNALTVVLGWLDDARSKLPSGAAREAIDVAHCHAVLGHSIARRAVGASVVDNAPVRGALGLVRDTVRGVTPVATRREVVIEVDEDAEDVLLKDAAVVQQILINLLLNAVAFTPEGETIRLTLRNESSYFLFRVRDDGPGIPPEKRDRIFGAGPSLRPGGAGIGLSHSHALAESRGGRLALLDGEHGACFELRWPVSDAPSATLSRHDAPALLKGMSVVILEDDPAVMSLLEFGLSSRGVEVFALASRNELDAFITAGNHVDAALMDLSPIADDPDAVIKLLRGSSPRLAIFLISGSAAPNPGASSVTGWIRKPFELNEVFQALARVPRP